MLGLSACGNQKRDDIGFGGDSSQSYVERYLPARTALNEGDLDTVNTLMGINPTHADGTKFTDDEVKKQLIENSSELSLIERGLLTLNSGEYRRALLYFDAAELKMEKTEARSEKEKKDDRSTFAALAGMEESQNYYLRGYEKVMIYNYKALCYMLLGDRKAYNVTRKAIDKQQEEWILFKERLRALENEEKDSETSDSIAQQDSRDSYTKGKAALVPSAYVNPFGDYMNAIIMEIDGHQDTSMRDNARIAYKKVLDNNKDCATAKQAAIAMRKKVPKGKKLVHVILADGFSPELTEKTLNVEIGGIMATANYAEATPHKTTVVTATVQVGKITQNMSSLSKLESLILRDDLDNKPFKTFMMAMALARTVGLQALGTEVGLGGLGWLASKFAARVQRPDTRTWLSLPNQILVARLYVPNSAKTISINTYAEDKTKVSTTKVSLAKEGPSVVYAVNYNSHLNAFVNESTWLTN